MENIKESARMNSKTLFLKIQKTRLNVDTLLYNIYPYNSSAFVSGGFTSAPTFLSGIQTRDITKDLYVAILTTIPPG
jgi:hypothetical protein